MDDTTAADTALTRAVAHEYVTRTQNRDWPRLAELLTEDMVYEMPQTRERVRGREGFIRFNREYPDGWQLSVRRVVADGPHAAVWMNSRVGDEDQDACVWLELAGDGRIRHITDFWPEAYQPPPGREHLVERW